MNSSTISDQGPQRLIFGVAGSSVANQDHMRTNNPFDDCGSHHLEQGGYSGNGGYATPGSNNQGQFQGGYRQYNSYRQYGQGQKMVVRESLKSYDSDILERIQSFFLTYLIQRFLDYCALCLQCYMPCLLVVLYVETKTRKEE